MAAFVPSLTSAAFRARPVPQWLLHANDVPQLNGSIIFWNPEVLHPDYHGDTSPFTLAVLDCSRGAVVLPRPGAQPAPFNTHPWIKRIVTLPAHTPLAPTVWSQVVNVLAGLGTQHGLAQDCKSLRSYIANEMQLLRLPPASFSHMRGFVDERFTVLSHSTFCANHVEDALDHWRTTAEPIRMRIDGTAGSGKTVAASLACAALTAEGQRVLMVCYNHLLGRSLPFIGSQPPGDGFANTVFRFARSVLFRHGHPGAQQAPADYMGILTSALDAGEIVPGDGDFFDALIVDEGQDFFQAWADTLLRFLRPDGHLLWFEDSEQDVNFHNPTVDLAPWVGKGIRVLENWRSPAATVAFYNCVLGAWARQFGVQPIITGINAPYPGEAPQVIHHNNDQNLLQQLEQRITHHVGRGIPLADILILSCRNAERPGQAPSLLLETFGSATPRNYRVGKLGVYPLQRYTGSYQGDAKVYAPDDGVRCESVAKVKGLEALIILLIDVETPTGISHEEWIEHLYTGLTRSSGAIEVFVRADSPEAGILAACLQEGRPGHQADEPHLSTRAPEA